MTTGIAGRAALAAPDSALTRARRARLGQHDPDPASDVQRTPKTAQALQQVQQLAADAAGIKELALAFERWHQDMIAMTAQTRQMHSKGEDLASIVKQLIMLSLNAAIEAARAGQSAHGFVVVASEVRRLALGAQSLSSDLSKDLRKNELLTATVFQDIQAGGKMMMAAVSGLESAVRGLRTTIE